MNTRIAPPPNDQPQAYAEWFTNKLQAMIDNGMPECYIDDGFGLSADMWMDLPWDQESRDPIVAILKESPAWDHVVEQLLEMYPDSDESYWAALSYEEEMELE